MKELLVPGSSLFPPVLFKVQGIRMQENLFKSFWNRSIMVYSYYSTETTFQHKALLTRAISRGNAANPIKRFLQICEIDRIDRLKVWYSIISTQFPISWPFSPVSLYLAELHGLSIKTQAEQQLSCQKRIKLCQGWRTRGASKSAVSMIMDICAIHLQTQSDFLLLPEHYYYVLTDKGTFIIQTILIHEGTPPE